MKKLFYTIAVALTALTACNDDNGIYNIITDLDARVTVLEELCKEMNTNISSLQTLIEEKESGDYITNVSQITKEGNVIGYTISFALHEAISIYNGENGKDGNDGSDGKNGNDGTSPKIGVKAVNNIYYWTLNGDWILDANGDKLRVSGKNGSNGENGTDGISPKLKIEDDNWFISYDNSTTWTLVGPSVGKNGKDGKDGDSMFSKVTYDNEFLYLTLVDGTVIQVPLNGNGSVSIVDGAKMAVFSVSETKKVYFSQGVLQFNASKGTHKCADGTTKKGTWRFADGELSFVGNAGNGNVYEDGVLCDNDKASKSYDGWIDLFGWATSGWEGSGATVYEPYSTGTSEDDYLVLGDKEILAGDYKFADWGVYNAISNGGDEPNTWRCLTHDEWLYLANRTSKGGSSLTVLASYDNYFFYLLFPDNFEYPTWFSNEVPTQDEYDPTNVAGEYYWNHPLTKLQFDELINKGAIVYQTGVNTTMFPNAKLFKGTIWTSQYYEVGKTRGGMALLGFTNVNIGAKHRVRLVKDVN